MYTKILDFFELNNSLIFGIRILELPSPKIFIILSREKQDFI